MASTARPHAAPPHSTTHTSPLLLGLPEEVLLHLVQVGGFTLTDIGHLRATCRALRSFLDRFNSAVNDCVGGDLSKYRPYNYWGVVAAAGGGHIELLQLMYEDEARHGRVPNYRHWDTNDEEYSPEIALGCDRWEVLECVLSHCAYDLAPEWRGGTYSRDQILFLLQRGLRYDAVRAIREVIGRGEGDLVRRLLPYVASTYSLREVLAIALRRHPEGADIFDLVLAECLRRGVSKTDAAESLFGAVSRDERAAALIDHASCRLHVALGDMGRELLVDIANSAVDADLIARLHALGVRRTRANVNAPDFLQTLAEGAPLEQWAFIALLQRGDFGAAKVAVVHLDRDSVRIDEVVWSLVHHPGAVPALRWLLAEGLLTAQHAGVFVNYIRMWGVRITAELADFQWALLQSRAATATRFISKWFFQAIEDGDLPLLRHLCEHVDVACVSDMDEDALKCAIRDGNFAILSYMMDVNARIAPSLCSDTGLAAFDARRRPFDLTSALQSAVHTGNMRMARMIDRRLPGLRASLWAACRSRRWKVFHFVHGRLDPSVRDAECDGALVRAMEKGRMEFARWFETNEPRCFERCLPQLRELAERTSEPILHDMLIHFPRCCEGMRPRSFATTYRTYLLEERLGVTLVERPLTLDLKWGDARGALQAAIDFRIPVKLTCNDNVDYEASFSEFQKDNPSLARWFLERRAFGEFVFLPVEPPTDDDSVGVELS